MKVINLFGGPNSGKSTTAAGLFHQMKVKGLNVELVTEYAKDMVWEDRNNILDDQLYILAKQNRRLNRLRGKVDWVVTDSPLLLGLVYASPHTPCGLGILLRECWASYENLCFYLPRDASFKFQGEGRVQQSHDEASFIDGRIRQVLPKDTQFLELGSDYISHIQALLSLN